MMEHLLDMPDWGVSTEIISRRVLAIIEQPGFTYYQKMVSVRDYMCAIRQHILGIVPGTGGCDGSNP